MGNPLPEKMTIGALGELLVQIRLLEYGIQAAPPIKDSGNDLIAVKGEIVKFIQVKTSIKRLPSPRKLPGIYHLVVFVKLKYSSYGKLLLDETKMFVFKKGQTTRDKMELNQETVNELWGNPTSNI